MWQLPKRGRCFTLADGRTVEEIDGQLLDLILPKLPLSTMFVLMVKCVWWGHPVSPATGSVDYFLSLEIEPDEGQEEYLEQMVRMDLVNTVHYHQVNGVMMLSRRQAICSFREQSPSPLSQHCTSAATIASSSLLSGQSMCRWSSVQTVQCSHLPCRQLWEGVQKAML